MITKRNYDKLKEQLAEIKNLNMLIWRILNELLWADYEHLSHTDKKILQIIYESDDIEWLMENE